MKIFLFFLSLIILATLANKISPKEKNLIRSTLLDSKPIYKGSFGKAFDSIKDHVTISDDLKQLVLEEDSHKLLHPKGWGVVSLKVDEDDLYGAIGILKNWKDHGPIWERPGHLTYYENEKELFSSYVGVRLHGGSSRQRTLVFDDITGPLGDKKVKTIYQKSVRVYFKKKYGEAKFYQGFKFEKTETPRLKKLIIHYDLPKVFLSDFTYWFAGKVKALTPETKPVMYYLNNKFHGFYYLVEHLNLKNFEKKLGHKDIRFYRFKSNNRFVDKAMYKKLVNYITDTPSPINYDDVKAKIDIKNFMASIFPYIFLSVTDWHQGVMYRNIKKKPDTRWRWYNWDMDHAISWRANKTKTNRPLWKKEGLELLLVKNQGDLRAKILSRLWKESPDFKKDFKKYCDQQLKWIKKGEYKKRLNYYRTLAKAANRYTSNHIDVMEDFMNNRIAWFEEHLNKWLTK